MLKSNTNSIKMFNNANKSIAKKNRGGYRGGDFSLVAPPRGLERKNPMGTNVGKSPISDNLYCITLLYFT